MRFQIGIAAAIAIAFVPAQSRAGVIHTEAWTPPAIEAPFDGAGTTLSVLLADDGSSVDPVFFDTGITGSVALLQVTMLAALPATADDRPIGDVSATAGERGGIAVGATAFQFANFINNAVAIGYFGYDGAPSGHFSLGMLGTGNIALVAAGLFGLGLTRRRDYIPPG